jgi:hypothetical protein
MHPNSILVFGRLLTCHKAQISSRSMSKNEYFRKIFFRVQPGPGQTKNPICSTPCTAFGRARSRQRYGTNRWSASATTGGNRARLVSPVDNPMHTPLQQQAVSGDGRKGSATGKTRPPTVFKWFGFNTISFRL